MDKLGTGVSFRGRSLNVASPFALWYIHTPTRSNKFYTPRSQPGGYRDVSKPMEGQAATVRRTTAQTGGENKQETKDLSHVSYALVNPL